MIVIYYIVLIITVINFLIISDGLSNSGLWNILHFGTLNLLNLLYWLLLIITLKTLLNRFTISLHSFIFLPSLQNLIKFFKILIHLIMIFPWWLFNRWIKTIINFLWLYTWFYCIRFSLRLSAIITFLFKMIMTLFC